MPDKIISFYDYGSYVAGGTIEGVGAGTLLDYSYWGAYANWSDRHASITGMTKKQYCPSSFNLDFSAGNGGYSLAHSQQIRTEGYGIQMFYNLKANNFDYSKAFNKIGNILFDDDVIWTGRTYTKISETGEAYAPSYESYLGSWTLTPSQGLYWYTPGPWWDWKNDVSFTLRIEENVKGKSYKVYGWGESGDDLPFIMDYTEHGRVEINLPQTATAKDNTQWQYTARQNYSLNYIYFITNALEPAFSGYLNSNGNFSMRSMKYNFTTIKTMAPVQFNGNAVSAMYGGLYQDVAYEPFTMTKK